MLNLENDQRNHQLFKTHQGEKTKPNRTEQSSIAVKAEQFFLQFFSVKRRFSLRC